MQVSKTSDALKISDMTYDFLLGDPNQDERLASIFVDHTPDCGKQHPKDLINVRTFPTGRQTSALTYACNPKSQTLNPTSCSGGGVEGLAFSPTQKGRKQQHQKPKAARVRQERYRFSKACNLGDIKTMCVYIYIHIHVNAHGVNRRGFQ